MIKKIIYITFFLITFLSCENKAQILETDKLKVNKIDSLANRYLELNRFSGQIIVAKNQTVIYNKSFGFADYEKKTPFSNKTAFKIGEISKIITENIILKLAENETIKLTDKVSKYLNAFESEYTINDLIIDNTDSNTNTLGKLIEKVSGKNYQYNIDEYGKTLKLENTFYNKENSPVAKGYLYNNYRGKGLELHESPTYNLNDVFSSQGIKSTGNDLVKIVESNPKDINISGYLDNDGFSYSLTSGLKNNKLIIVLSNRKHPVAGEISNSINAILDNNNVTFPLLRQPYNINKNTLKNFTGSFSVNENINFKVVKSNDSLFVLMGPNKVHLVPQSNNQFYMNDMDASMRFLKDSTGIIKRVVLLNGFIDSDQQAIKIE